MPKEDIEELWQAWGRPEIWRLFAALAALKLQEEGKLKLTDTVKQWVPEVAFT